MTIDDREVIEALRDEPELLALADAVQSARDRLETPPPLRPGRARLRPARVAAVGLAVAAALVLLLVSPWDSGSGPSLVDRALAAVGNKPVLHMVERFTLGQRVDLRTGKSTPLARDLELWYDESSGVFRAVGRIDGRVISRTVSHTSAHGFGVDNPVLVGALYREALTRGKLRKIGVGVVRGRHVVFVSGPGQTGSIRGALDAKSYRLVRLQFFQGGRLQSQLDVLVYETVSRAAAKLPSLTPGPASGTTSTSSGFGTGTGLSLAKARTVFGAPPLWLGRYVDGHRLNGVELNKETDKGQGRTVHGESLEFQYGVTAVSDGYLDIEEAPVAVAAPIWRFQAQYAPATGYLDLTSGETTSSGKSQRTEWTGLMQKDGFYVKLTGYSRPALIRAAKALVPLPRAAG